MQIIEIIAIVLSIGIVAGVTVMQIVNKKKGKYNSCSDCSFRYNCKKNIKEVNNMTKYLKCENCGAIVKVIKPCTCQDCGIKCCGKSMVEFVPTETFDSGKIVKCNKCGAEGEIVKPCTCENCGIRCCGEEMK